MGRKIKLLILFFCITTISGFSQVKYYIVFCAKDGIPGHAFVSFGKEDYNQQISITDGSWGLYPNSRLSGAASYIIGEVPGGIANDFLTKIDFRFIKEVDGSTYTSALAIKNDWLNKNDELLKSDCVSFVIEVANKIPGLKLPQRSGLENLPVLYLQCLIEINRDDN